MKKLLAVLTLTFALSLVSHADDKTFFGAYWTTAPKAKLYAGPMEVTLYDVGNVAGIGTVVVKASDDEGFNYEWEYMWTLSRNKKVITFTTLDMGEVVWRGSLNIVTGNLVGSFRGPLGRGRFQATPKLF